MPQSDTSQNLLFCILALQMGFIEKSQLVAATSTWISDKTRRLDQILLEQDAIDEETRALLEAIVDKHLAIHDGDVEKSLEQVSSIATSVREELAALGDVDVEASLDRISVRDNIADSASTQTFKGRQAITPSDRFRIVRPHARGGLGEVSVAIDQELHREVAFKEIQKHHADNPDSRARFILEAEITGGLEHPGVVPVYGLGAYADGRPFYAMRFIKGDSLKEANDRFHAADSKKVDRGERSLALRALLQRFIDVCDAIEYAHSRGILHRDIKPGNIMLGKYGETLVVDWGLAKIVGRHEPRLATVEPTLRPDSNADSSPTRMGSAVGTPSYMSPEQAAGQLDKLGPPTDIYSLGATLYFLLTGQAPYRGSDSGEILRKVQSGEFSRPSELAKEVPAALEAICLKAMSKEPQDRYESPRALAEEIEHWLADERVLAYGEPLGNRMGRWVRHHKSAAASLLTALVVLVATATFFVSAQLQRSAATRDQVATLTAEAKRQNADGNVDGAIRMLALATGLLGSSDTQAAPENSVSAQLAELNRYRDFTQQANAVLAGGVHGINAQHKPDPLADACTNALAVYKIETESQWTTGLRSQILSADQIEAARVLAARLLIMKAIRLALFDTKGAAGRAAAREAIDLFRKAEQLQPPTIGIWMCRMMFHRRLGEDEEADKAGEQMTKLAQSNANRNALDFYLLGSITLHILKKPESAIGLYKQSLAAEGNYYGAAMGLFFAENTLGNAEGELNALNRCLAIRPGELDLYHLRGVSRFRVGQYELAIRDFERHAEEAVSAAQSHYWRGRCHIMLDEWDVAEKALTKAIELDEALMNRLSWRALARSKLQGLVDEALADVEIVLGRQDSDDDDKWRCARALALASAALTNPTDVMRSEELRARSVELLKQLLQSGGIKKVQLGSSDLDALRERADFLELGKSDI